MFPEFSGEISSEDLIGLSMLLSDKLVLSLQSADYVSANKVVKYILWLNAHSKNEEMLMHTAIDTLRDTIQRSKIRSEFWKAVSANEFKALSPLCSAILKRDADQELEREHRFTIR